MRRSLQQSMPHDHGTAAAISTAGGDVWKAGSRALLWPISSSCFIYTSSKWLIFQIEINKKCNFFFKYIIHGLVLTTWLT